MKHVIIGAGPAGVNAAAMLRQMNPQDAIIMFSGENTPPYAKMVLPYLLAGVVEEKNLHLPIPEGVLLHTGRRVVRIDPQRQSVETDDGKTVFYDRLLIATGGVPEKPTIEGHALPFVATIRDLPDVRRIQERLQGKTGHAVIAGAGPVSMETGDALHRLGMKITFIVSSNRVFSMMLDRPAAAFVEDRLRQQGVDVLKGEDIARIDAEGKVTLQSGTTIPCDLVIFGKGVNPCIHFLAGSGLALRRGILVDEYMETNIPGVFAAGDAVEARDLIAGEQRVNALWPVAVEQGRVAARNMAGVPATYEGSVARNILRVFGLSILVAGMGRADGPDVRVFSGPDFYHKIVLDGGVLKGFIFIGEIRREGLYRNLLQRQIDITPFTDAVHKGNFNYSRYQRWAMRL
ncbi:MAG: NAD(P)/FAD-dependent oxidoreductase [Deltaproteobacteria bacterium]|nr:NAD(P)/FAD-dependent oxidoreductase [Deltaproteobacteria bacterium]